MTSQRTSVAHLSANLSSTSAWRYIDTPLPRTPVHKPNNNRLKAFYQGQHKWAGVGKSTIMGDYVFIHNVSTDFVAAKRRVRINGRVRERGERDLHPEKKLKICTRQWKRKNATKRIPKEEAWRLLPACILLIGYSTHCNVGRSLRRRRATPVGLQVTWFVAAGGRLAAAAAA